ncbi:MAG: alpha-L-fucosidase [Bacteroidetes bacterium]|nr:alpha-L-fucosidase [Bacteroidota bacterium]
MKKTLFLILSLSVLVHLTGFTQNGSGEASSKMNDPKMTWWKEAKFGMFIHWGVYSVPAGKYGNINTYGEWIMNSAKIPVVEYAKFPPQFNPTKFNAEEWVLLAKAAGQRYIVITSKHHDGFAMFKSDADKFNIYDATPFKRDPLRELADACKKYSMKLGFYYSQAQDWNHKGGAASGGHWDKEGQEGSMEEYMDKIAIPQVKEILSKYGDVAILWWDTPTNMTPEMTKKLIAIVNQYPNLITNNRLGAGAGGDIETPEQFIPATGFPGRNWEVCMTMNGHWGYNAYDENWKSTKELLIKLIDIASKGGNFLLNVGPTAEGIIPEVCANSLKEMGEWLKINGESIYGVQPSPFPYLSWGRATQKGQKLFLHVLDWPKNGKLFVPMTNIITKAYLLQYPQIKLTTKSEKERVVVNLPKYGPDKVASVIVLEFKGNPSVLPVPTRDIIPTVSSESEPNTAKNLFNGDPKDKWQAKKGENKSWIEVDLKKSTSISCFSIVEPWHPWDNRGHKFALQYKDGTKWTTIIEGKTKGSGHTESFAPIKAQLFRLNLEAFKDEPIINEFMLFRAE